jgi:hypothetical protein
MLSVNEISSHSRLFLLDLVKFSDQNLLNNKRECERKGTELILNHINTEGIKGFYYDEEGKPCLSNGGFISISHSKGMLGLLYNEKESCGLDIEVLGPKAFRVRDKFLSAKELRELENIKAGENIYTLYWAIKESLYKINGKSGLIFAENIFIPSAPRELEFGKVTAEIILNGLRKNYLLAYHFMHNHVMVYLIESTL